MNKKKVSIMCVLFLLSTLLLSGCKKGDSQPEEMILEATPLSISLERKEEEEVEAIPEEEEVEVIPVTGELTELEEAIESMLAERVGMGETWAVYVEDMSSGSYAVVNDQKMRSASIIKLFTAATTFARMGELNQAGYSESDILGLVSSMIRVSDNDANNTLVTRLGEGSKTDGFAAVNRFCEEYGFSETHMGRYMLEQNPPDDNYTSVIDMGHLLSMIYKGEIAGADTIMEYMKQQERTWKIPAGLPQGVASANKTGELNDVENDVAFVFATDSDYVICVMSENLTNPQAAQRKISDISGLVYNRMTDN